MKFARASYHKISNPGGKPTAEDPVNVPLASLASAKTFTAALRRAHVLVKGQRAHYRIESGQIVVFPCNTWGITCWPHSIILTPEVQP